MHVLVHVCSGGRGRGGRSLSTPLFVASFVVGLRTFWCKQIRCEVVPEDLSNIFPFARRYLAGSTIKSINSALVRRAVWSKSGRRGVHEWYDSLGFSRQQRKQTFSFAQYIAVPLMWVLAWEKSKLCTEKRPQEQTKVTIFFKLWQVSEMNYDRHISLKLNFS